MAILALMARFLLWMIAFCLPTVARAQLVGINTRTPVGRLSIAGNSGAGAPLLLLFDSLGLSASRHLTLAKQGVTPTWDIRGISDANPANARLYWYYNNLVVMSLAGDGRLGLGTASPAAGFHVSSNVAALGNIGSGTPSTQVNSMYITVAEAGQNNGYFGSFSNNKEDVDFGTFAGNNQAQLHLVTNNQARLTVDSLGAIGIGTRSPQNQLTVNGGIQVDANYLNGTLDGNGNTRQNWLRFGSFSGEGIGSNNNPAASNYQGLDFYTNSTPRMTILRNGNLGIGTTAPQASLHVNGNVRATVVNGLQRVLTGNTFIGSHNTDSLVVTLNLGNTIRPTRNGDDIRETPIFFTVQQSLTGVSDAFTVRVNDFDRDTLDKVRVLIRRVDSNANGTGWGQSIRLHWIMFNRY